LVIVVVAQIVAVQAALFFPVVAPRSNLLDRHASGSPPIVAFVGRLQAALVGVEKSGLPSLNDDGR